jgi:DNA modification methylase
MRSVCECGHELEYSEADITPMHRLLCGDSTVREDVERVMDGERADAVVTDPPYNVEIVGGTHDPRDKKNYGRGPTIDNDNLNTDDFRRFLELVMVNVFEVLKPGGVYYVCSPPGNTETLFRNVLNGICEIRQCIVWVKQQFVFGRMDYHWRHESVLYGWKNGAGHYFTDDKTQDTVWEIDRPMRSDKEHPTQKPLELVQKAIGNSTLPSQCVIDPFGGSGTTMVAAEQLGRACRMIEIEPRYCAVILERMQALGLAPERA